MGTTPYSTTDLTPQYIVPEDRGGTKSSTYKGTFAY